MKMFNLFKSHPNSIIPISKSITHSIHTAGARTITLLVRVSGTFMCIIEMARVQGDFIDKN